MKQLEFRELTLVVLQKTQCHLGLGEILCYRKLDVRELRDSVINKLCIHPGGQRLLVHVRDSRLWMLDLSTATVIQWFNGALNHRYVTMSRVIILIKRKPGKVKQLNKCINRERA